MPPNKNRLQKRTSSPPRPLLNLLCKSSRRCHKRAKTARSHARYWSDAQRLHSCQTYAREAGVEAHAQLKPSPLCAQPWHDSARDAQRIRATPAHACTRERGLTCARDPSERLTLATSSFARRLNFRSSGPQRWQKPHMGPFAQRPACTKAQGLQLPSAWPAEPRLGSSGDPGAKPGGGGVAGCGATDGNGVLGEGGPE